MTQPRFNDPFYFALPERLVLSDVRGLREHFAERFGITGGTVVRVGNRDFGTLCRLSNFEQVAR